MIMATDLLEGVVTQLLNARLGALAHDAHLGHPFVAFQMGHQFAQEGLQMRQKWVLKLVRVRTKDRQHNLQDAPCLGKGDGIIEAGAVRNVKIKRTTTE